MTENPSDVWKKPMNTMPPPLMNDLPPEQRMDELEKLLRDCVGRLVLLESAVGTFVQLLPKDVSTQLLHHLDVVALDLAEANCRPLADGVLGTLRRGISPAGPGASLPGTP